MSIELDIANAVIRKGTDGGINSLRFAGVEIELINQMKVASYSECYCFVLDRVEYSEYINSVSLV